MKVIIARNRPLKAVVGADNQGLFLKTVDGGSVYITADGEVQPPEQRTLEDILNVKLPSPLQKREGIYETQEVILKF